MITAKKVNMISESQKNRAHIKVKETREYRSKAQTNGIIRKEEFDRTGHKIEETTYSREQSPLTETTWRFNRHGDCVSQTTTYLDKGELLKFNYDYEYDGERKMKITKHTAGKDLIQEHHFSYGQDEITERIFVSEELHKTKIYNRGNLLLAEISHANNFEVTYEYDDRGNVTVRKEKRPNHRPDKIIKYRNTYDEEDRLLRQQRGNEISEFEYNSRNDVSKLRIMKSGRLELIRICTYRYYES